ncbi:MAG: hypothetical protein ABUL48_05425 [Pseudorhodoplanes sp.]
MPGKRKQTLAIAGRVRSKRDSFRGRYEALERRRAALVERLDRLRAQSGNHPSYKRARILLNEQFRKAAFAQRLGVLRAAHWLIDLIEMSTGLI